MYIYIYKNHKYDIPCHSFSGVSLQGLRMQPEGASRCEVMLGGALLTVLFGPAPSYRRRFNFLYPKMGSSDI